MIKPSKDLALVRYFSPQTSAAVKLSANESPYAPPPQFQEALSKQLRELPLNRYPDREATELRERLAYYCSFEMENIWCANGSNEVLLEIFLTFGGPGRKVLIIEPTYRMHSHIAHLSSTGVIIGSRNEDFKTEVGDLAKLIEKERPDILFFCSPNNPTGNLEKKEAILWAVSNFEGLIVIDEAYSDFANITNLNLVKENENVIILKTFSKTWALAGLRLGYSVANKEIINCLRAASLPYSLNTITQVAGSIALDYVNEMAARVEKIIKLRDELFEELKSFPGIRAFKSYANFIMFKTLKRSSQEVYDMLLADSVLVRDVSAFLNLENCLRVSVGTHLENERFLESLKKI